MGEPPSDKGGENDIRMASWSMTDKLALVGGPGTSELIGLVWCMTQDRKNEVCCGYTLESLELGALIV